MLCKAPLSLTMLANSTLYCWDEILRACLNALGPGFVLQGNTQWPGNYIMMKTLMSLPGPHVSHTWIPHPNLGGDPPTTIHHLIQPSKGWWLWFSLTFVTPDPFLFSMNFKTYVKVTWIFFKVWCVTLVLHLLFWAVYIIFCVKLCVVPYQLDWD